MIYRKLYMDKILPFIDTPFTKILTGVRRCGKSTILRMLKDELIKRNVSEEQILFYQLDSLKYENLTSASDLWNELKSHLYPSGRTYLFLDEIQEIDNWEKVINSLMTEYNVDIYITGSNSRMMSGEISTYLTGRYISFRIFPLTFCEYLEFRKAYTPVTDLRSELLRFIRYGGFPAIHLRDYTPEEAYTIVKDIYNSTIFTDIVKRNQIRKIDQLERIVKYTFDNVGQTFSALTLSKYMKSQGRTLDSETVYHYLEKLEKAYILHRCSRYDIKGKEYLKTQEKFYLADPSFQYALLGYHSDRIAAMLENIVYIELASRGYEINVGKLDTAEIDFIATKPNTKIYIQVSYQIQNEETKKREYNRLLAIRDNYPKYVVRMDDFTEGNYEGIHTLHLCDFLLSRDY